MTDDKLIEDTAKAIIEASHGEGEWEFREPIEEELYLRRARAALTVFEKAHAPTDGEREVISVAIRQHALMTHLTGKVNADDLADVVLALGFRRSQVREPSGDDLTSEQRHTLVEGAVDAIEPNATNRTHAYNIWNNIASDERFVRAIMTLVPNRGQSEPQGEPSDAETLAALNALMPYAKADELDEFEIDVIERMRAALRTAVVMRASEAEEDLVQFVSEHIEEQGAVIRINEDEAYSGDGDFPKTTAYVPVADVASLLRRALRAAGGVR